MIQFQEVYPRKGKLKLILKDIINIYNKYAHLNQILEERYPLYLNIMLLNNRKFLNLDFNHEVIQIYLALIALFPQKK